MVNNIQYASVNTTLPGNVWLEMTDDERLVLVNNTLNSSRPIMKNILEVLAAKENGEIIVDFLEPVGASERGTILLDFEEYLKSSIDPGLTVWLEPLGDRNSLRKLRGVEVIK